MKSLLAGGLAAAGLVLGSAQAAIVTTGTPGDAVPDLVVGTTVLGFTGVFEDSGPVNYSQGGFLAGPIAGSATVDIGIINSDGTPAGFDDLVLTISSSAGTFDFNLTEDVPSGAGMQLLEDLFVDLAPGELFSVMISGTAFAPGTSVAFLSVQFSAEPIPLPAAGLFFATGLAGVGAVRRMRGQRRAAHA